jgi:hypothetical protein
MRMIEPHDRKAAMDGSAMPRIFRFALLALALAMPALAWATFKPIRILAPELNGVTCSGRICVEDPGHLAEAIRLQRDAVAEVGRKLVPLEQTPLTVFCSTRRCYRAFGGGMERGATLLDRGVILPPDSWVPYIVQHEYIHMLQAQQLGLLGRQRTPEWFKEGMPFFVSDPPQDELPAYARPLAARYQAWEHRVGRRNVWHAATNL